MSILIVHGRHLALNFHINELARREYALNNQSMVLHNNIHLGFVT